MKLDTPIFVAGHNGMVGSAILRELKQQGYQNLIVAERKELDLTQQLAVQQFIEQTQPQTIFLCAAKVGGIHANQHYPAEFIYSNLMIQNNIIHQAYTNAIPQLLFLGSSCIYPRQATQPMHESELLSGPLEPTNEPYAVAKIAGIKMCESYNRQYGCDFRSVMPTNLYGVNDNFHPKNSHVVPALIRRFHEAKLAELPEVEVWGSGNARREFLYVDDMAKAAVHVMQMTKSDYQQVTSPTLSHINIGTGQDCSIRELATLIKDITGYQGDIIYDASQPDGTPRKLLDSNRLNRCGWQATTSLRDGLTTTYQWFLDNHSNLREDSHA